VPDSTIYTNEQALNEAEVVALSIADPGAGPPTTGKLRFFDSTLIPDSQTTQAQMILAEIALGGYPAGGYTITAMLGPDEALGGGAVITTPAIHVAYTVAPGAVLGGGWIEDSAGETRGTFIFDPARSLQAIGQGFIFIRQLLYGRNTV
jgi:hypothetical protein